MKQKWIQLTWPQRVMICIQGFLLLLFLILQLTLGRQQVTEYRDEYLRCRTDGEVITYSGKIDGKRAVFTVSPGPVVEYQLGDTRYGPYSIVFDSTAVPSEENLPWNTTSAQKLVGVEVWQGETRLFRGAYRDVNITGAQSFYLVDSQGDISYGDEMIFGVTSSVAGSTTYGYSTQETPGPYTILKIAMAPGVVQRGHFGIYLLVVLLCVLNAVSILYADALFRWNLRFRINNADDAEPSDWELFSRWFSWLTITICALVFFIISLNYA